MGKMKKIVAGGLVLAGLAGVFGLWHLVLRGDRKTFAVYTDRDRNPTTITIYDPRRNGIVYIDKKPFGSLDYVLSYEHTSDKVVKRKPKSEEYRVFSELEIAAKERGMLLDLEPKLRDGNYVLESCNIEGGMSRPLPSKEYIEKYSWK